MACSSMASISCLAASARLGVDLLHPGVDQAGGAEGHRLAHERLGGDVPDLLADEVELGDRLAELLALGRVFDPELEAIFRPADAAHAQLPAPDVQDVEGDLVALADGAQHVLRRHHAVLEDQRTGAAAADAQLVLLGAHRQAGRVALDQEAGELAVLHLAVGRLNLGEHGEQVGEAGVGDELLRAGQAVALAVGRQHRLGLGGQRVRARARLGQGIGGDQLAAGQAGQVLLLLFGCAEQHQGHGPDADVGPVTDGERSQPADRLEDQAGLTSCRRPDRRRPRARRGPAGLPRPPCAGSRASGQAACPRSSAVLRLDLPAHEIVGGLLHHALLVGQRSRGSGCWPIRWARAGSRHPG